jgi:hypothetical protein
MTLDEFVAQAGETPQGDSYYWIVEVDRVKPDYRRSEYKRTKIVQCQDTGPSEFKDTDSRYWFYTCGNDIYRELDDIERVICKIARPLDLR